ncbi:hypothetical protein FSW04_21355 [Baekduia soli]|uniref:Uncharacterized protein n=1 Tax=Baekduia soli TaxID=496014 RepID=A0A5B8UB40_9ACTN|nr:hypothetical protein [Baekduia soli]QEC49862.1 hypothetical protein FSW04_21355 [Baekduia soli]
MTSLGSGGGRSGGARHRRRSALGALDELAHVVRRRGEAGPGTLLDAIRRRRRPPLLEALDLAELAHLARSNRMRAI